MKRYLGSSSGFLILALLSLILITVFLTPRIKPAASVPLLASPSIIEPTVTKFVTPPTSPTPTTETLPYPVTTTIEILSYPEPTGFLAITPTDTTVPTLIPNLPIIVNYPKPGPFIGMKIFYFREEQLKYYISSIDGKGEIEFIYWWRSKIANKVGPTYFMIAPDGSKFLYAYNSTMDRKEPTANSIWISNPDGSNPTMLVSGEKGLIPEEPIWSPDSRKIAFRILQYKENLIDIDQVQIWTMNADGAQKKMVSSYRPSLWNSFSGTTEYFRWLLDGYIYYFTRDHKLSAINPETGQVYVVLDQVVDELILRRALSPDGTNLLLCLGTSFGKVKISGLKIINVNGECEGWSDDGKYYVASGSIFEGFPTGIWIVEASTGKGRLVTHNLSAQAEGISPDNRYFAFHTKAGIIIYDLEKENEVFTIPSDSSNIVQPSTRNPIWIPVK